MSDADFLAQAASTKIIIPVLNGGLRWKESARALLGLVNDPAKVIVIDSQSVDGSDVIAKDAGFTVQKIERKNFNHGATRQGAIDTFCADDSLVVLMSQDCILESKNSIPRLLDSFRDLSVGMAYGRQLPHIDAQAFGAHAAHFNYGPMSETRSIEDVGRYGIKTAYVSNSFAAYRICALREAGGFPNDLILGEDAYVAIKMLSRGIRIRYCAEALAYHSHDYQLATEARRYFDFGVMHTQIGNMLRIVGGPDREGVRFALSEIRYVSQVSKVLIPYSITRSVLKYLAYRAGRAHRFLPKSLCRTFSLTQGFWSYTTDSIDTFILNR